VGHLDGTGHREAYLEANAANVDGTVIAFVKQRVERIGSCDACFERPRLRRGRSAPTLSLAPLLLARSHF
jgi:hypothetical protein